MDLGFGDFACCPEIYLCCNCCLLLGERRFLYYCSLQFLCRGSIASSSTDAVFKDIGLQPVSHKKMLSFYALGRGGLRLGLVSSAVAKLERLTTRCTDPDLCSHSQCNHFSGEFISLPHFIAMCTPA